jgi:hypothetical protein
MDSRATLHMVSDPGILSSPSPTSPSAHVTIGNGVSLPISSTGHTTLSIPHHTFHLNNVIVVPSIIKNLFSTRQFTIDNSCSVEYEPFGFSIKDLRTRREIMRCSSPGPLYEFSTSPSSPSPLGLVASTNSTELWHRRLGHPGHDAMSHLSRQFAIPCNNASTVCHACQLGKHVRLPFSRSQTICATPFELIHCDLWTSPVTSNSGFKYYLVIIDDFSHFMWTFPLRRKSETADILINFVAYIRTQFNLPLVSLQTDNGTEFVNSTLVEFLTRHGIHLRMLCPYTSPRMEKLNVQSARLTTSPAPYFSKHTCHPLIGPKHLPPPPTFSTDAHASLYSFASLIHYSTRNLQTTLTLGCSAVSVTPTSLRRPLTNFLRAQPHVFF